MKTVKAHFIALCVVLACCTPCLAESFKPYPGSKLDEKLSREASVSGAECQVYETSDGFDKIYAFYKPLYRETMTEGGGKRGGTIGSVEIQWAFFILDDAKDLAHSKSWLKIQYPFVGGSDGREMKDVRKVSVIQLVRKK